MLRYTKLKSQRGITLILTLIWMQIVLLLSWYAMENALTEMRMATDYALTEGVIKEK